MWEGERRRAADECGRDFLCKGNVKFDIWTAMLASNTTCSTVPGPWQKGRKRKGHAWLGTTREEAEGVGACRQAGSDLGDLRAWEDGKTGLPYLDGLPWTR